MENPTTNAVCQRIGHRPSGKRTRDGLPICSTCYRPFRDDEDGQPSLTLSSFNDPDGAAILTRRPATRPPERRPSAFVGPVVEFRNLPPGSERSAITLCQLLSDVIGEEVTFFVSARGE